MAGHFHNYQFGCRNTAKYDSLDFIVCNRTAMRITFRRAAWRARTPKCHMYCSFDTNCGISRIGLAVYMQPIIMTFRRAAWRARTPKCHSYCSSVTDYEIVQIVITCNSAAKVIIMKRARHAANLNVIITTVSIQTVESRDSYLPVFLQPK